MRCQVAIWTAVLLAPTFATGCRHTSRYEVEVPVVEEFRAPPQEDRFNNPPEKGYTKPLPKKEFKPGGGPGGAGGGMGSPPQF